MRFSLLLFIFSACLSRSNFVIFDRKEKVNGEGSRSSPGSFCRLMVEHKAWFIFNVYWYSYGHLLVITGYKWDYTFYKWGYKYL